MEFLLWFLILIGFLFLLSFGYGAYAGAPWVPTRKGDVERFITLVQPKKGEALVELGCGDARLLTGVVQQCGVTGRGIELSLAQVMIAKYRAHKHRAPVSIVWQDVRNADLSDADIVYMFLMPKPYKKLREKFEKELRPGTRVVSYAWEIPEWTPERFSRPEGKTPMYLYVIGSHKKKTDSEPIGL